MKKSLFASLVTIMLILGACSTNSDDTVKQKTNNNEKQSQAEKQKEGEKDMNNVVYPQLTTEVLENEQLVEMETSMGTIKIKLFPEYAPKTVENFVTHSKNGYYDGVTFHRVIDDFMIQGGDPDGTGRGGESIYGHPFEDEFSDKLFNLRGALSMANAGPNTNGSQFFIVQNNSMDPSFKGQLEKAGYPKEIIDAFIEMGGTPYLNFKHTVFGQVIEGMDVVDKIAKVEVDYSDKPVEDVIIKKITVIK
ncbi:peptidylprolyl isomerase [Bacillus aquiflavi]|uniref:Peptidyl-prolyl cis-trans isomerase n=1 Tax=Bacillus aquiflavi TaxID=2672567 RepID=A0A6B3VYJ3_9BACI|nr:peptidylprolyl isomerase [Bacillus aquiflavi]MBA4536040.1 peptidylprolyl isomerase [Bacillus aquiflavi]NEY80414.1 peptidylprolyl isomerase [Bacillus aquiflavi]